jgi:hypothetical protein
MPRLALSLYRITRTEVSWTVVAALDDAHALKVAHKLKADDFTGNSQFAAWLITEPEELPAEWSPDAMPWVDPDKPNPDGELTCGDYLNAPPPPPVIDEAKEHALYQLIHGSVILRAPRDAEERHIFERHGIHRTADNLYFTTIKPLPAELKRFFACYAIRPDSTMAELEP